jgi:hypothetical protein
VDEGAASGLLRATDGRPVGAFLPVCLQRGVGRPPLARIMVAQPPQKGGPGIALTT